MPIYLILALISAVGYSLGGLLNKQAMTEGCGFHRSTACMVWFSTLLLAPFAALQTGSLPLHLWHQPLMASLCFSGGMLFFILALRVGDLSLVAPVSGVKPVLNALLVAGLLGTPVPPLTWIACALTAVALLILKTPNRTTKHSFLLTFTVTLLSALCFALCDTCFQQWASAWGVFRFAFFTFSIASVAALALIPKFEMPWGKLPLRARSFLLASSLCFALPSLCMGLALGRYGHAPEVNVVYSSRALLSILAVRFLGPLIGSIEHSAGKTIFLRRLVGALILLSAIALILAGSAP